MTVLVEDVELSGPASSLPEALAHELVLPSHLRTCVRRADEGRRIRADKRELVPGTRDIVQTVLGAIVDGANLAPLDDSKASDGPPRARSSKPWMVVELLGGETTPDAGLALHADAPGVCALLDCRGPHGLDGRPQLAGPVFCGLTAAFGHGLAKVRIESRVRARIEHCVHWNIRRLTAVREDAAAGEVPVGRETFQKVPHDVDVGCLVALTTRAMKAKS